MYHASRLGLPYDSTPKRTSHQAPRRCPGSERLPVRPPLQQGGLGYQSWLPDIPEQGPKVVVSDYSTAPARKGTTAKGNPERRRANVCPNSLNKVPRPSWNIWTLALLRSFLTKRSTVVSKLWKQWAVPHLVCVYLPRQKLLCETLRMSDYIQNLNVQRKTNSDHLTELFPYGNNAHSLCSLRSAFIWNPYHSTLSVRNQLYMKLIIVLIKSGLNHVIPCWFQQSP